jgi:hypothetical protein
MAVHAHSRSPGELERHDEHDEQGDEATHGRSLARFPSVRGLGRRAAARP